jgi:hypothetical protein
MDSKMVTDEFGGVAMHNKIIGKMGENQIKEATGDMSPCGNMFEQAEGIKSSKELTIQGTYEHALSST